MFWGFSEAFDIIHDYKKHVKPNPTKLNVLLYGSGDPRHILTAISKNFEHDVEIDFYVIDGCVELIARNMLLIGIALEPTDEFSLKCRTYLFLDIYGNSYVNTSSRNYTDAKAKILTKFVTDAEYLQENAPIFDLDLLKYRERDGLVQAFRFWQPDKHHVFNLEEYWRNRVHQALGTRYDYRDGAFDWDLQMTLKDRNAQQICSQEYRIWRDSGIAFVFPEHDHAKANKTFAVGLVQQGNDFKHRGYVGDIEIGPFCTFGLRCSDLSMMKSFHGVNDYRAGDVAERNVLQIMFEIHQQRDYQHEDKNSHKLGAAVLDVTSTVLKGSDEKVLLKDFDTKLIQTPKIKIHFLSVDDIIKIWEKPAFEAFFDIIFVGNMYFKFCKDTFLKICKENALLVFETKLYSLAKNEQVSDFLDKIKDFAKSLDLKLITNFNLNTGFSVLKYKQESTEE